MPNPFKKTEESEFKQTTTVKLPEPTPEEKQLLETNVSLAEEQLNAILSQGKFQQAQLDLLQPVFDALQGQIGAEAGALTPDQQEELFRDQFDIEKQAKGAIDELLAGELERIRAGGAPTQEQRDLIRQATEAGIAAGQSDINKATTEGLQMLARELSPSLGLRPSDTPIVERGARIVAEGIRQQGQLETTLRGQEAQQLLQYPLESAQVYGGLAEVQQRLAEQTRQFQANLRQMAWNNRLALTGQIGQQGLGLASIGNPVGALQVVQMPRLAQTSTTTTGRSRSQTSGMTVGEFGQLVSGTGALATGVGSVMAGGGAAGAGATVPPTVP